MDAAYDDQVYVDDRTIEQPHQAVAQEVQGRRRRLRDDRRPCTASAIASRSSARAVSGSTPAGRTVLTIETQHPRPSGDLDRRATSGPSHPPRGLGVADVRLRVPCPARFASSLTRAHRLSKSRRPWSTLCRCLFIRQSIPRGPDRRARAEPADAGRDHCGRDLRLGQRRYRPRSPSIRRSCCSRPPVRPRGVTRAHRSSSRSTRSGSARCCGVSSWPTRTRAADLRSRRATSCSTRAR